MDRQGTRRRSLTCAAATAGLVMALAPAATAAIFDAGSTRIVSRPSGFDTYGPGLTNDASVDARGRAVSPSGRFVAFASDADGLSVEDDDRYTNVFVKDVQTGEVILVSRADGVAGAPARGNSREPSIQQGSTVRVAFATLASLVPADTNDSSDVYLRDVTAGTTELISRADGALGAVGGAASTQPALSGNGTSVAFTSEASNLVPGDTNERSDVFVRQLAVGRSTTLISRKSGVDGAPALGVSREPSISFDGTRVAFTSDATLTGEESGGFDVFVRDLRSFKTTHASRGSDETKPVTEARSPSLSADGQRVSFVSIANLTGEAEGGVYVRDLAARTTTLASRATGPTAVPATDFTRRSISSLDTSLSGDGQRVAFETSNRLDPADANDRFDVYVRDLTTGETVLASAPGGGAAAGGDAPSFSVDGRVVVFQSEGDGLSDEDDDGFRQVFSRDLAAAGLTLVSRPAGGAPATGVGLDAVDVEEAGESVSADGRFAVFTSAARALSPLADGELEHAYVRDNLTGETALVSRASGGAGAPANSNSYYPAISADGRRVVFSTEATNLVATDTNSHGDIYVRDLTTEATVLVSRADAPDGPIGDGSSDYPSISADGNRVAFASSATNLVPGDTNGEYDVFVRDLAAGRTVLASRVGAEGPLANGGSFDPSISADGTRVAFESGATNLSAADSNAHADVFIRDIATDRTILASRADGTTGQVGDGSSTEPALSADGNRVAFSTRATNLGSADTNGRADIYVRDLSDGQTLLVSRGPGQGGTIGDADSDYPSISADGSRIAFASRARNLARVDAGPGSHAYVRDLTTGTTVLASRADGPDGAAASQDVNPYPSISANGRCVLFMSRSAALDPAGYAGGGDFAQVYLRVLDGTCPGRAAAQPGQPDTPRGDREEARSRRLIVLGRPQLGDRVVRVPVRCLAAAVEGCRGTLRVTVRVGTRAGRVGTARLAIAAGKRQLVRVESNRALKRTARPSPRVRLTVTATVRDASGHRASARRALVLTRARAAVGAG